jgi:hypothetical protein
MVYSILSISFDFSKNTDRAAAPPPHLLRAHFRTYPLNFNFNTPGVWADCHIHFIRSSMLKLINAT